jgi:hypothetical protein
MVSTDTTLPSLVHIFALFPSRTGNYFSFYFILLNINHLNTLQAVNLCYLSELLVKQT